MPKFRLYDSKYEDPSDFDRNKRQKLYKLNDSFSAIPLHERSDLDIVVVLGKPDMFNLIGIKQDLEEAFQRHVDIVRYREKMNLFLKKRIENEAIYV